MVAPGQVGEVGDGIYGPTAPISLAALGPSVESLMKPAG